MTIPVTESNLTSLTFLTSAPTLNFSSSWVPFLQLLIPTQPCHSVTHSLGPPLSSPLPHHGPVYSAGHAQFTISSPCSGVFQMPLAVLSQVSTLTTFPSAIPWRAMSSVYTMFSVVFVSVVKFWKHPRGSSTDKQKKAQQIHLAGFHLVVRRTKIQCFQQNGRKWRSFC